MSHSQGDSAPKHCILGRPVSIAGSTASGRAASGRLKFVAWALGLQIMSEGRVRQGGWIHFIIDGCSKLSLCQRLILLESALIKQGIYPVLCIVILVSKNKWTSTVENCPMYPSLILCLSLHDKVRAGAAVRPEV